MRQTSKEQRARIDAMLKLPDHFTNKDIAERERIDYSWVCKLRKRLEICGSPWGETRSKHNALKLTPAIMGDLVDLLLDKPGLYLDEMQRYIADRWEVPISKQTISRQMQQQKWTKKKTKLQARKRDDMSRASYLHDIASLCAEQVVFCGENGTDRPDGGGRTVWSPVGVTPAATAEATSMRHGRFYVMPAISAFGILDAVVYQGDADTERFVDWLERALLPKMNPFPADNSVLVMDTASWHRSPKVRELCDAARVKLVYIPPYSPDFNPVEPWFNDLKARFRRECPAFGGDGDDPPDGRFEAFLRRCIDQEGTQVAAIRGHYAKSHLRTRHEKCRETGE